MKKLITGIIIAAFTSGHTVAQKIKVLEATQQGWSGGLAGHHGTNYSVTIKEDKDIKLDSLFINNNIGIHLDIGESITKDTLHHTLILYTGESHIDPGMYDPMNQNAKTPDPLPSRHYTGAALITYYYKGRKQILILKELKPLPALNYP